MESIRLVMLWESIVSGVWCVRCGSCEAVFVRRKSAWRVSEDDDISFQHRIPSLYILSSPLLYSHRYMPALWTLWTLSLFIFTTANLNLAEIHLCTWTAVCGLGRYTSCSLPDFGWVRVFCFGVNVKALHVTTCNRALTWLDALGGWIRHSFLFGAP